LEIKPTIGRKVWYWPTNDTSMAVSSADQALDATVIYVHEDGFVNLFIVDHMGAMYSRYRVPLYQGDVDSRPRDHSCATWMPYQREQASKASIVTAEEKSELLGVFEKPRHTVDIPDSSGRIARYILDDAASTESALSAKLVEMGWTPPGGMVRSDPVDLSTVANVALIQELARRNISLTAAEKTFADPCLAKRRPGEPMFTLLGRDPVAASLVRLWAAARDAYLLKQTDPDRLANALDIADKMERWSRGPSDTRPLGNGVPADVLDLLPLDMLERALSKRGYTVLPNAARMAGEMKDGSAPTGVPRISGPFYEQLKKQLREELFQMPDLRPAGAGDGSTIPCVDITLER
jgi:hypothetical protein